MKAEYVRNLNCNYQRLEPGEQPDEKRYQYCIMERVDLGICSLAM